MGREKRAIVAILLALVLVPFFLLWSAQRATAVPVLTIDKIAYTVPEGGTTTGTVTCTDCVFPGFPGVLLLSTLDPSIATVSPFNMGPILTTPFSAPFTITGASVGTTTVHVALFQGATLIPPVVTAAVSVTPPGGPCPISLALRSAPERRATLETLYRFRDEVLTESPEGRQYIRRFYQHTWEGSWLLLRHPALRLQTRAVLARILPTLQAVVDGQPAALTAVDVAVIEELMDAFAAKAGPRLQRTIEQLRSELRSGEFLYLFGIDVGAPARPFAPSH